MALTTYTIEHRPYGRGVTEQVAMGLSYKAACIHLTTRGVAVGGRYGNAPAREHAYDPSTDPSGDWHGGDDGVYRVTRVG